MEAIYVLNENGSIQGVEDRTTVHQNGLLHAAVQCWVMNENGEILIQKRASNKDKSAGKWDVSFGGHCAAPLPEADIFSATVIKEGAEELGLDIKADELIKLGEVRYTSQQGNNREILGVFLIRVPAHQEFYFTDGEVAAVQWITPTLLAQQMPQNPQEYANRSGALFLLQHYLA